MPENTRLDVAVVGGGAFGTTLASILCRLGRRVSFWAREEDVVNEINRKHTNRQYLPGFDLPRNLRASTDLAEVVTGAPVVLLVVPSKFLRGVARTLSLRSDQVLVHTAKGIEVGTGLRMSEVLRAEIRGGLIGVLSGPNLAREVMAGLPAGAVVASEEPEVASRIQALFAQSTLRIYRGTDVIGVEVGGAFKNVVALAAGAVDGMDLGDNAKALLVTRGLSEMIRYGVAVGAKVPTFSGLAGVGDLITTCASPLSRNHQVGYRLARGETLDAVLADTAHVAEGVTTSAAIHAHAQSLGLDLHIVHAVHEVLYAGWTPRQALDWLMSNPAGSELELPENRLS